MILAECGHQVIPFLSATEALRLAARMPVNLIITDLYMPEKDGLEVIHDAQKLCPKVPVIAISGVDGVKSMLRAASVLGASHILQKPFSKEQLLGAVATVMDQLDRAKLPAAGVPLA